jgi:YggT family protein
VFALFAVAVLAALASWLVRTRRVSPFSPMGRGLRRGSDWLIKPVEALLLRTGGNPVHAGWWLVIGVAVAGIVLIGVVTWLVQVGWQFGGAARAGPRGVIALVVDVAYNVLFWAILIRVIGSWLGVGPYTRWMRPVYWLTDWLIEPIRRALPAFGMLDLSPLVAILVLWVLRALVFAVL